MTDSTVFWCHSLVNGRFNCLLMPQPCQWQVQLSFDVTALSMTGSTVIWCHSLVNERFNCLLMSQPCQWQVQLSFDVTALSMAGSTSLDVTALSMAGSTVIWCHSLVNDRFNCSLMSQPCQWQVQLHLMSQPCQWQAQMSFDVTALSMTGSPIRNLKADYGCKTNGKEM